MSRFASSAIGCVLAVLAAGCFGSTNPVSGPTQQSTSTTTTSSASDCTARVSGFPSSIGPTGGRRTFTITTGSNCTWTASSDAGWAPISPTTGQGTRTITLNVSNNTRFDTRTMVLTVNSDNYSMLQTGIECVYRASPSSLPDASNGGETAPITLTITDGCAWTATASESWIRPVPASGTGSGTIILEIAPYGGDSRSAFVTIGTLRINVTQRKH